MGRFIDQPGAPCRPTPKPCHVGFGERFIDENELFRSHLTLFPPPAPAGTGDIRTILLGRVDRLFFNVRSRSLKVSQIKVTLASTSRVSSSHAFSSSNVVSGTANTRSRIAAWCAFSFGVTGQRGGRAFVSPVSRRRPRALETYEMLTRSISAITPTDPPSSEAANARSRRSCP